MNTLPQMRCAFLCSVVIGAFGFAGVAQEVRTARGVVFHDENRNRVRDAGEDGLPGILVSNQREVTTTDADGRWRLSVSEDDVVFVVKPRGWMTPVGTGNPQEV